jgi:hypothetical protein
MDQRDRRQNGRQAAHQGGHDATPDLKDQFWKFRKRTGRLLVT